MKACHWIIRCDDINFPIQGRKNESGEILKCFTHHSKTALGILGNLLAVGLLRRRTVKWSDKIVISVVRTDSRAVILF